MTSLKPSDIRDMSPEERDAKLQELRDELMHERGTAAMGGAPSNPGLICNLRRNIARIITVQREEKK
ncbi:MAG: large subunit ribosomal protein [Candidatus Methanomethylophilaceae archaeon]|jgi:LSU ribosomal protein L29P|nr:large subunit ribosomal protein [Candidatus Methanomethylophilaceae archaeon]MDI3541656.1 large subunit ribosomal protein [Candidatus Methanomethylophilaceae archaeon]HIJ00914.1 50S ribosomal protein L29 [Candidatus Methanomethylophilaceae archaeon]